MAGAELWAPEDATWMPAEFGLYPEDAVCFCMVLKHLSSYYMGVLWEVGKDSIIVTSI